MPTEDPPGRPLDESERATLAFLLSAKFEGRDALILQANTARVTGKCPCGCATVYLWVDRVNTAAANVRNFVPIQAVSNDELLILLLFVRDGWLDSLEIAWASEKPPATFPPPETFRSPLEEL